MKKNLLNVLLVAAVGLTACSPATVFPGVVTPLDPDGAALTVQSGGADYRVVRFEAGKTAALNTKLTLSGINLAVNDTNCTADKTNLKIICDLGKRLPASVYVLPVRGLQVAEATYAREGGPTYRLTAD